MEIRKNSVFDNVPVVLMSGLTYSRYINDAFSNGANYYLIKANNLSRLIEHLKAIFSVVDWKKVMYYPPIDQFVIGAALFVVFRMFLINYFKSDLKNHCQVENKM